MIRFAIFVLLTQARIINAQAPCVAPSECQATINASWDNAGVPDTRPGTWGNAASVQIPYQFNPPAGFRVRVLRVYGDHIAWPHGAIQANSHAGVLWSLLTTAPGGSEKVQYGSDDCFVYHQGAVGSGELTQYFDHVVSVGGLLEPDNKLILQLAVFLNETGVSIHQELTADLIYQWEPNRTGSR